MTIKRRYYVVIAAVVLAAVAAGPMVVRAFRRPPAAKRPGPYTIYRTAAPIKIDGKLDEPGWFAAPGGGVFQFAG